MNKIVGSRTLGFLDDQIATMKDKDIKWLEGSHAPIADQKDKKNKNKETRQRYIYI